MLFLKSKSTTQQAADFIVFVSIQIISISIRFPDLIPNLLNESDIFSSPYFDNKDICEKILFFCD